MKVPVAWAGILLLALLAVPIAADGERKRDPPHVGSRSLSFEDRLQAQEAIERVYYSYVIGAVRPFEEAVARSLLKKKVRTYLAQSVALEQYWHTPVTRQALERELERIAANTRFPERLEEIYAALGREPLLILECFVRPILVDRLARGFFADDERIHRTPRGEIERISVDLSMRSLDPYGAHPRRMELDLSPVEQSEEPDSGSGFPFADPKDLLPRRKPKCRHVGQPGPIEENREAFRVEVLLEQQPTTRLAVYEVPKTPWDEWWDEARGTFETVELDISEDGNWQALPMPATPGCSSDDTWDNGSLDIAPEGRRAHASVWTGSLMLIWGGTSDETQLPVHGWRYDPLIDTWSRTSTVNAPQGRRLPTAVWTGSRMIVWGGVAGSTRLQSGGLYDPVLDTWQPTTFVDAPTGRSSHSSVWTGSRMVVWGGTSGTSNLNSGGSYDPVTDTWEPTTAMAAPTPRMKHTAVWDGNGMIVWGGVGGAALQDGGRYDPSADTWSPLTTMGAPTARYDHAAVWSGQKMIVWGGSEGLNTGGRYDPDSDSWLPVTTNGAPEGRWRPGVIWTGARMIVWGGLVANGTGEFNSGGLYDPANDSWDPTSLLNAPMRRVDHTSIWTGDQMIVWGGTNWDVQGQYSTGGRYDPDADVWTPTAATSNGPTPRTAHSAVWTGTQMVVWGGDDTISNGSRVASGGRYDPLTDSWKTTTFNGAPTARAGHTAVWTGDRMLIWAGSAFVESNGQLQQIALADGGAYDPVIDSWIPISTAGSPSPRAGHRAVWTGTLMLVWGGFDQTNSVLGTGGAYDPVAEEWTTISGANAPAARTGATALWTGNRMLVWGGADLFASLGTGGRYDPLLDTWETISVLNAPAARRAHSAVWTGERMVVWGGRSSLSSSSSLVTGGLYDPVADTWQATTTTGAPLARSSHTAVWTGDVMVVWGGQRPDGFYLDTGGRYDPDLDAWTTTSTAGAPSERLGHTAVWSGSSMLVWGGVGLGGKHGTGGRYFVSYSPDADQDGHTLCDGDCVDSDPMTYPGAPQTCDGVNNDCHHPAWPSMSGTNEADDDGDSLSECQGDCDDANTGAWGTPGVVRNTAFANDGTTLTWNPPITAGAMSLRYDTVRSGAPSDFVNATICTESNDGADVVSFDASIPAFGQILYYLVRAENDCPGGAGLGPVGTTSSGLPRTARICP